MYTWCVQQGSATRCTCLIVTGKEQPQNYLSCTECSRVLLYALYYTVTNMVVSELPFGESSKTYSVPITSLVKSSVSLFVSLSLVPCELRFSGPKVRELALHIYSNYTSPNLLASSTVSVLFSRGHAIDSYTVLVLPRNMNAHNGMSTANIVCQNAGSFAHRTKTHVWRCQHAHQLHRPVSRLGSRRQRSAKTPRDLTPQASTSFEVMYSSEQPYYVKAEQHAMLQKVTVVKVSLTLKASEACVTLTGPTLSV